MQSEVGELTINIKTDVKIGIMANGKSMSIEHPQRFAIEEPFAVLFLSAHDVLPFTLSPQAG